MKMLGTIFTMTLHSPFYLNCLLNLWNDLNAYANHGHYCLKTLNLWACSATISYLIRILIMMKHLSSWLMLCRKMLIIHLILCCIPFRVRDLRIRSNWIDQIHSMRMTFILVFTFLVLLVLTMFHVSIKILV